MRECILGRLASVQEHRSPQAPRSPFPDHIPDKGPIMENIQARVADHDSRVSCIEVVILEIVLQSQIFEALIRKFAVAIETACTSFTIYRLQILAAC